MKKFRKAILQQLGKSEEEITAASLNSSKVDRNPFYRTMDIFNGAFNRNVQLEAGTHNSTDLSTIWINFGETKYVTIEEELGATADDKFSFYRLSCGHRYEGSRGIGTTTRVVSCYICGSEQAYLGFEHEWQHIIFKSDLAAREMFVVQYSATISQKAAYNIDTKDLQNFLYLLINAFDDIRVNSLWERVYPGSAMAIWERWKGHVVNFGESINTCFLSFVFATAFNLPTKSDGDFAPLKDLVEWVIQQIKHRGFTNLLTNVRILLNKSLDILLPKFPARPPISQSPNQGQNFLIGIDRAVTTTPRFPSPLSPQFPPPSPTEIPKSTKDGQVKDLNEPPKNIKDDRTEALRRLLQGTTSSDKLSILDNQENHSKISDEELLEARKSQSLRATIHKILSKDISDLEEIQKSQCAVDSEMEEQIEILQSSFGVATENSILTAHTQDDISIIRVTNQGSGEIVDLSSEDKYIVNRLRSAIFRSLGRQKNRLSSEGGSVDVEAYIQYVTDRQDSNIFEKEQAHRGFAYSILCDMSGSMISDFHLVTKTAELLKAALKFPFVDATIWGFRGGDPTVMYKYDPKVHWYIGTMPEKLSGSKSTLTIQCGGGTPMHSALHVALTHLDKITANGMAKRLFLITDGSPSGNSSQDELRESVAKEIQQARSKGIQVYTMVIGDHSIDEAHCNLMFGSSKYWRKVLKEDVSSSLSSLVLTNFSKYLKTRGRC